MSKCFWPNQNVFIIFKNIICSIFWGDNFFSTLFSGCSESKREID